MKAWIRLVGGGASGVVWCALMVGAVPALPAVVVNNQGAKASSLDPFNPEKAIGAKSSPGNSNAVSKTPNTPPVPFPPVTPPKRPPLRSPFVPPPWQ